MGDRALELYDEVAESDLELSAEEALTAVRSLRQELDLDPEEIPTVGPAEESTDESSSRT
jgi:hypothetical protein